MSAKSIDIMLGIRNYWKIKPVTKIHGTKKGYDKNDRKQGKEECKKHIDVKV
jgi:hypothetical protein